MRDPSQLGADGVAFEQIQKWLVGAKMLSCGSNANNQWTCIVRGPNGKLGFIVWNPAGNATYTAPKQWHVATYRDLSGKTNPIAGGTIDIGPTPVEMLQ